MVSKFSFKWLAIPVLAIAMMFMGDTKNADAGGFSLQIGGVGYGNGFGYPGYRSGFGVGPGFGYGYGAGYGIGPYRSGYRGSSFYSPSRVNRYYSPSRSYYNRGFYGGGRCR